MADMRLTMMEPMEKRKCFSVLFIAMFAFVAGSLFSCQERSGGKLLERQDLFSLEYGAYGKTISFSTKGDVLLDFDTREGIFHILDIPSRKVLRLSSYGDILSVLFDPRSSLPPEFMPSTEIKEGTSSESTISSQTPGRYAAPAIMTAPSLVAIDSAQTLYIVDKPAAPLVGDAVIRRFGALGREQKFIGQEGLESTPFPPIIALHIMGDDSLGIVSSLSEGYLLHRFSSEGVLLSAIKLDSGGVPLGIAGNYRQNVDSISMKGAGDTFEIALKIDLYAETLEKKSGASAGFDAVESWIATIDGTSGQIINKLRVWSKSLNTENPVLLGQRDDDYVFMQPGTNMFNYSVSLVDAKGKVQERFRMELPQDMKLVSRLKLVQGNRLSGVVGGEDSVLVLWWALP